MKGCAMAAWSGRLSASMVMMATLSLPAVSTFAANPVLSAGSTGATLTYQLQYDDEPGYFRLYLDTDRSGASGFPVNGTGADYLIENNSLYQYAGSAGSWNWSFVKTVAYGNGAGRVDWSVAIADLGAPAGIDLIGQVEAPLLTSAMVTQTVGATLPPATVALQQVVYTPSTANIANPERGFYRHPGDCDTDAFNVDTLRNYRLTQQT